METEKSPLPSLDELLIELKEQDGFKAMLKNTNDEERKSLEESVISLMENYYNKVLKPLSGV